MTKGGLHTARLVVLVLVCCTARICGEVEEQGTCSKDDGVDCGSQNLEVTPVITKLDGVEVGHVQDVILDGKTHQMKTLSMKPQVLEIQHFLTDDECDHVMRLAEKVGMFESVTNTPTKSRNVQIMDMNKDTVLSLREFILTIENSFDIYLDEGDMLKMYADLGMDHNADAEISREELYGQDPKSVAEWLEEYVTKLPHKKSRMSRQAWLYPSKVRDKVLDEIQERVVSLVGLPRILIDKNDEFQVVQYGPKGHYHAHWDSGSWAEKYPCCHHVKTGSGERCKSCRFMTVLLYLNKVDGGGATAFPIANNETFDEHSFRMSGKINLHQHCEDANLVVPAEKGKAIIWYNHHLDPTTGWVGELDSFTLHGGCGVTRGQKWIANKWILVSDEREKDMDPNYRPNRA
ncbi:PREDICTED: transmembrane prolyl 4-hydroxylase-like [Branchiostoma belcheri]|uniref:Transmembrane prolyl 4-hydroxylase-like n=1 Tax=Branchiostoma belcheri TaxID=7741 RepID=A0A6P4ZBX5_BRABE|nr:PREDICTED: transmembrane prolyl 4-hydroxylase-like [Branchiostoma belcheri]